MNFLKSKIDSKDQFVQALAKETHSSLEYFVQQATLKFTEVARTTCVGSALEDAANYDWWVAREWLRIDKKIYKLTDTLRIVNKLNPWAFAHISNDDPKMVAYTPDRAFGTQDRQLRLTCSKLLSKLFPVFSDFYIAALAADHEAEVNGVIEFVTGPEIAAAYAAPGAPHSCMAPKLSFRGVMPSLAYDMPKIKMAVLRSGDKVTARCMVYEDGDDKRYIRNYGDQKLARRLERAGYRLSNWHGVEFKPVRILYQPESVIDTVDPTPIDPEAVANYTLTVPYLDANGGAGSGYGSSLYLLGGRLYAFGSTAEQSAINALATHPVILGALTEQGLPTKLCIFPDSGGRATFTNIPASLLEFTCCISGKKYNSLRDQKYLVWVNGEYGYAAFTEGLQRVHKLAGDDVPAWAGKPLSYWVPEGTPTFVCGGYTYRDTEANRIEKDYRKHDPAFYPEADDEWVWGLKPTHGQYGMLSIDAVYLIDLDEELRLVHKTLIQKKVHVKLHGLKAGYEGYAVAAKVYRTSHGRKVHPKFNDVLRTFDGYELPRNVDSSHYVYYGGEKFYYVKGEEPEVRKVKYEKGVTAAIDLMLDSSSNLPLSVQTLLAHSMYCTQNAILTASVPELERMGRVVRVSDVHKATLDELEVIAKHWLPQSTMDCELLLKRTLLKIAEVKANDYSDPVPASNPVPAPTQACDIELEVTEVQIQPAEVCHV